MKRFYLFLIMTTLTVSSSVCADYSYNTFDECGVYVQKSEHERNKLINFEGDVIAPMVNEMQRLKKTIDYRIRRPRKIENSISKLENEIRKLEIDIKANDKKIDLLTSETETLETQGSPVPARKKRKKIGELERQNIKKMSKVERKSGEIDDLKEEAQEIRSTQPPLQKLEDELAQLEMELADQDQIKRHLVENVSFYDRTLGMCRDYQQLLTECGNNK